MAGAAAFGRPTPRVDGPAKVTGTARYGADHPVAHAAHAFLVTSAIARGRIRKMHCDPVRAMPGVLLVLTHGNAHDVVAEANSVPKKGPTTFTKPPLASPEIFFAGQIVALVVAESLEIARDAALQLRIEYEPAPPTASFDDPGSSVIPAEAMGETRISHGDTGAGWKAAAVQLELRYETPPQHHNPLELYQATCEWQGEQLIVWESSQNTRGYQHGLAKQLGIPAERITVRCPFVGGAFGSRGQLAHYTALVAHAARELGRPVKLVGTRQQAFTLRTFRAETRHEIRIAADRDGQLRSLAHESWELTSREEHFALAGSESTARLYACGNIGTEAHNVLADRQMPGFMRAPPELPYLFAMESAMDELAHELGMDPVELRRRNETQVDPVRGVPYTTRSLLRCYEEAAAAFGWHRRQPQPAQVRDGDWLVGYGCATAMYPAKMGPAECRLTLLAPDRARVEIGSNEIGNGTMTILSQLAADRLGLELEQVEVILGSSALPATPITAGSNSATTTCNAVARACDELLRQRAANPQASLPLTVHIENRVPAVGGPEGGLDKVRQGAPALAGGVREDCLAYAFGAQFVEVRVHAVTGEIRVPRLVGAFACGRIANPLTARSQLMAGQVWGLSSALLEATEVDRRTACYVNHDLAEYLVPTNADVGEVTTLLVPEEDTRLNPLGMKGAGEIGATGVNAAVANAIFNATGRRLRSLPIRLDQLLL